MSYRRTIRPLCVALGVAAVAIDCSSAPAGRDALAGRYELRSVNGRSVPVDALGGAVDGEIVLARDGRATRVVRYATSGVPGPIVRRASGTFVRRGAELTFVLRDEGRPLPEATWQARGELAYPSITLRYPSATGKLVEERHLRAPD